MNADDQLDTFRRQWKKELKSENTSKTDKTSGNEGNVISQLKDETCKTQTQTTAHKEGTSSLYYPFQIAGNLLETNSNFKLLRDDRTQENECKKNLGYTKRKNNKRLKLTKLEDLFVEKTNGEIPNERLLDKLISDIDEITEIPFFDIDLPREVAVKIFQFLDIKDLCSCAQVSKSWCSLAEDELLWCRLCHRLGRERVYTTCEKTNWKQIVQHNVERQRTLISNWKNRTGKLSPLEHVKGKILSAVHSCGDIVVAGYTSGDVKLWNLSDGDSCVFQPSSTSLLLHHRDDDLQENIVNSVCTSEDITVAAYSQGNVDIWSLDVGSKPFQNFTPSTGNMYCPKICLSTDGATISASYGPFVDVLHRDRKEEEFSVVQHFDCCNTVNNMMLYQGDCDIPAVIFSKEFSVQFYQPQLAGTRHSNHVTDQVTEIHNLIGAPIDIVDFKTDQSVLGVALGSYGGLMDGFKVKMYDIKTSRLQQTLEGHTWMISCMNLQDSPPHQLVTGSGDRKLRIYDMRSSQPEQTLIGHSFKVSCVQMDDWKVVSGSDDGFLCVWDRRMAAKLWEWHNRHPVKYSRFYDKTLIVANISSNKFPQFDDYDNMTHRRYRGTLNAYNFLEDVSTKDVPEICLSSYDQPDASKYNISLAVPYDTLNF